MKKTALTVLLIGLAAIGLWRYVQPSNPTPIRLSTYQNQSVMIATEPEEKVKRAEPVAQSLAPLPLLPEHYNYTEHLQVGNGWRSR